MFLAQDLNEYAVESPLIIIALLTHRMHAATAYYLRVASIQINTRHYMIYNKVHVYMYLVAVILKN